MSYKFRLLHGNHIESTEPDTVSFDDDGKEVVHPGKDIVYYQGEVFESETDLAEKHNRPGAEKFERMDDATRATHPEKAELAKRGKKEREERAARKRARQAAVRREEESAQARVQPQKGGGGKPEAGG